MSNKRAADSEIQRLEGAAKFAKTGTCTAAATAAATHCALVAGTRCRVGGLKRAQHHNEKWGTVGAFNPATGRYVVLLQTGESLALQPANIFVTDEAVGIDPLPVSAVAPALAAALPETSAAKGPGAEDATLAASTITSLSRVLQLCNMVTAEELADPDEYRDILSDVRDECAQVGGAVASITIPRLDDLSAQPPTLPPRVDAIGLIFVEFEDVAGAEKARRALDGRTFGENVVFVLPYPEADYAKGILADVRVALAAADEAAKAALRRTGVVRMWNLDKGFGFVREHNGTDTDIFVHARSLVTHCSFVALDVGQRVSFLLEKQLDGRYQAVDVRDPDGKLPVDEAAHQAALAAASDKANVSVFSDTIQGHKPTNEDRFTNCLAVGARKFGKWIGVYDGHGGEECAQHLATNLHHACEAAWQGQPTPTAITAAFVDGFARVEAEYLRQAEHQKWLAGSTACVVLLHGWQPPPPCPQTGGRGCMLWCANLGDTRAVLCRGGKSKRLSEDHKPDRPDEKRRVEAAGGFVLNMGGVWRATNNSGGMGAIEAGASSLYLAVSRAFGDPQLKKLSATSKTGDTVISAVPEVKSCALEPDDLFFVVACDG